MSYADLSSIVGAVGGVVALIVGLATGYLKLFVANQVINLKNDVLTEVSKAEIRILEKVESRHPRSDYTIAKFTDVERRLTLLEERRRTNP